MKPITLQPEQYISRFCSDLQLRNEVITLCNQWMKEIRRLELNSGRNPVGIAASLIYMASIVTGQSRTQREIADITNVTEVTIRNRYKELSKALNVEISV
jgi:transcription initiation factor TFIIB